MSILWSIAADIMVRMENEKEMKTGTRNGNWDYVGTYKGISTNNVVLDSLYSHEVRYQNTDLKLILASF